VAELDTVKEQQQQGLEVGRRSSSFARVFEALQQVQTGSICNEDLYAAREARHG
jgi:hypothetical protein